MSWFHALSAGNTGQPPIAGVQPDEASDKHARDQECQSVESIVGHGPRWVPSPTPRIKARAGTAQVRGESLSLPTMSDQAGALALATAQVAAVRDDPAAVLR